MPHDRRRGDEAGEVSQAEDGQGEEARPGRQIRWILNIAAITTETKKWTLINRDVS